MLEAPDASSVGHAGELEASVVPKTNGPSRSWTSSRIAQGTCLSYLVNTRPHARRLDPHDGASYSASRNVPPRRCGSLSALRGRELLPRRRAAADRTSSTYTCMSWPASGRRNRASTPARPRHPRRAELDDAALALRQAWAGDSSRRTSTYLGGSRPRNSCSSRSTPSTTTDYDAWTSSRAHPRDSRMGEGRGNAPDENRADCSASRRLSQPDGVPYTCSTRRAAT